MQQIQKNPRGGREENQNEKYMSNKDNQVSVVPVVHGCDRR
jgi:hypothetical protein